VKLWIYCIAMFFTLVCYGQEPFLQYYERQNAEANKLHDQKEHAKAIAILEDLRRRPELQQLDDELLNVLYNLACEYSLSGDKDKAIALLRDAAATGSLTSTSLERDSDFDKIRQDSSFKEFVRELQVKERPIQLLWNSSVWQTPFREDLAGDEKIAGLSQLWSEAKYNFAFFDRRDAVDWDALYISYLPKVQATKSTYEYYRVLSEFYAQLHDGHTNVSYPRELGNRMGWPAITTRLVEGRVFIDEVRDPALKERGVVRGLEIVAIDGFPVREYGEKFVAPHLSASTPQDLEVRTFENSLLGGLLVNPVALTLRDEAGKTANVILDRLTGADADKLPHAPWTRFQYKLLPGNIAYVALRSFGNDALVQDFDAAFAEIRKSDALILDVRENSGGSSNIGWAILGYLTSDSLWSTQWRTRDYRPAYRAWGSPEKWYSQPSRKLTPHGSYPYKNTVVVLTSPHTYSAAEDFAVVFDAMKRGMIIGEPTGGSTGQPLAFPLPGGGSARVCTKHDRYPDGKEFVGVGIQPGILVRPTVEDFRAARDTVLSVAIRELQQSK
jgi:C-terminal processing protease CtpA/Prc